MYWHQVMMKESTVFTVGDKQGVWATNAQKAQTLWWLSGKGLFFFFFSGKGRIYYLQKVRRISEMFPNSNIGEVLEFLKFIFNWRIIALQRCFGFCHTSTCINHRYTYVPSLLNLPATSFHPPRLLQSPGLSSQGKVLKDRLRERVAGHVISLWMFFWLVGGEEIGRQHH